MAGINSSEVASIWYGAVTDKSGTIATGGISQVLSAENRQRRYLFIQNPSTQSESLFVNLTTSASTSANNSFELLPGATLQFATPGFMTIEQVNITAATISHPFVCKEA